MSECKKAAGGITAIHLAPTIYTALTQVRDATDIPAMEVLVKASQKLSKLVEIHNIPHIPWTLKEDTKQLKCKGLVTFIMPAMVTHNQRGR